MFADPLVRVMVDFLTEIGINTVAASALTATVFPGLDIQHGAVLIDETRLVHVGDIFHEAGHLAVTHPRLRLAPRLNPTGGEELAALAWSYAAASHLGLEPAVVFYPESYHDFGNELVANFAAQVYVGLPLLQTFGMTLEPKKAIAENAEPFPHMLRWLR